MKFVLQSRKRVADRMHVGVFLEDKKALEGGGFTFIHDIAVAFLNAAQASPHSFTLFCPASFAKVVAERLPNNVNVAVVKPRNIFQRIISELRHAMPIFAIIWQWPTPLDRLARTLDIDVIWFVGGSYDTLDTPYFTTVWDLQHRTHPWFPEVSAAGVWEHRDAFFSRHLGRAARIITGTEVGRREIVRFYGVPFEKIRVVPHPTPRFALAASEEPKPEPPRNLIPGYLFYPAQFWAHKNHVNLLRGYRLLCDRDRTAPALVFSGAEKGNLFYIKELVKKLGLERRVHFLGFVSIEEIVALYCNAGALVYASFSGPENLPPLEAFALECPVVASDFSGAREQLGDAALYFDPHQPMALCNVLMQLVRDPVLRTELVAKGRQRASRWTSDHFVKDIFLSLDEFAAERAAWGY